MSKAFGAFSPTVQAIIFMIIAVFFFTVLDACAKQLSQSHHTIQVVWARFTFQSLWAIILLAPRLPKLLRTRHLGLQLLRSAFLFGATIFFFFGLKWLTLSDTTAIFEVAPLLVTAFAFIFLGEKVGMRRWISVLVGLLGAMIIIRPGSEVFALTSLVPVAAATCYALYAISTRFLGREESPWTSFLYTALIGTVVASLFVALYWTEPTAINWALMVVMGGVAGIGHFCLIKAFSLTEVSFLAPLGYLSLLFNTLWGFIFFYEVPSIYTVIGASIIVGAGVYVWYRENKRTEPSLTEVSALPR